jgi:hypothetical protein
MRHLARVVVGFVVATAVAYPLRAQEQAMIRTVPDETVERLTELPREADRRPEMEIYATFKGRVVEAKAGTRGEAWFSFTAELRSGEGDAATVQRVVARVPITSTEDAYGESRSCAVDAAGAREMIYTAGLDEANFVPFHTDAGDSHDFRLLLNKYLCRVLAAPFRCGGVAAAWPEAAREMKNWRIVSASVIVRTARPAEFEVGPIRIEPGTAAFDYGQCAAVAPSDGVCCVQGRTTDWHCGGTPVGTGWKQVSGECFHRETGGSCKDGAASASPMTSPAIVIAVP